LRFRTGNYGNVNNNGPPDGGNEPPSRDNHGDNGDNGPPPTNDNNNISSTVPPRFETHANPLQANIRPRTAGRNIRGNVADNDDISSVSSTSSILEEDVQQVLQSMDTKEDDSSWYTDMAERHAPLGKYREPYIPPYSVNDLWVHRVEWLDDIKYCLKDMYGVISAKSGYGRSTASIEEEKVLDVIGERNVHGVQRMVTTSVLTKDCVMSG
jgi:hypothetical protein